MEQAKQAGATITDPAHDTFWGGYSGHFQDPDGYLWEIVWNPHWDAIEYPNLATIKTHLNVLVCLR